MSALPRRLVQGQRRQVALGPANARTECGGLIPIGLDPLRREVRGLLS